MVLINSCREKQQLTLLYSKTLQFPSASAIEIYNHKLYLLGDDAPYLLILDTAYQPIDSIRYINTHERRISKQAKPDIESCFILENGQKANLIGIGSMSADNRFANYSFSLGETKHVAPYSLFSSSSKFPSIEQINIEGSAFVKGKFVLANRANTKSKTNHLLFFSATDSVNIIELNLNATKDIVGVSGLYYWPEGDILFFTASTEFTADPKVDGAIGDSYIGWVNAFSKKMNEKSIDSDNVINLSAADEIFVGQKIESICVQASRRGEMIIHLVADNDNGNSKIFKAKLAR